MAAHGREDYRPPRGPRGPQRYPVICDEVVTISEKVMFPINEYPGYNFVGKLLGPKGSNLKALVLSTKSKISILGKGSSKDKAKEEELSKSEDPEHAHFKEPLHVLVQVKAPKIVAHRRIATALKELNHYMVPQRDERGDMDERPPINHEHEAGRSGMGGRGDRGGAPIIRVGIPPPGAVIIGGGGDHPREGGRRGEPPARDPYAPDDYYEGRGGNESYRRDESYRRAEKRSVPPANDYSPKRYRDDGYNDPYAR